MADDRQLVQISLHKGAITRVPPGETPIIEMHMTAAQYVTNVTLEKLAGDATFDRKTVDWKWTAFVVTPLGPPVVARRQRPPRPSRRATA